MLVVNAACKHADYRHLAARLPSHVTLQIADARALLALQGPKAVGILARHAPAIAAMPFMTAISTRIAGYEAHVSRSGYTGEDGCEISIAAQDATAFAELLLAEPDVKLIGLGARDSLRLEAGLCLYGHDIDTTTSPVEAGLTWSIQKRRREQGGFPGASRIQSELREGPARMRVGIRPEGRAPAREGADICAANGIKIGVVTSGGFGPTVGGPIAMGYVTSDFSKIGTAVDLSVRGKALPAKTVPLPFVAHRYHR
jgi:aminomethyltransferase